jgi:hypothetical protein
VCTRCYAYLFDAPCRLGTHAVLAHSLWSVSQHVCCRLAKCLPHGAPATVLPDDGCTMHPIYSVDAVDCCVPCLQDLLGMWEARICGVLPDSECEVLYGRAGYLYSLTWLQQQLGQGAVPTELRKVRVWWCGGGGGRWWCGATCTA